MLLHAIDKILHVNADLALRRDLPDKWMLEELIGVRALVIVLDENRFDEILKLGVPSFGF